MNIVEKIKRSWWIILSFIIFINGFGFLYIGFKNNNKNWVLEGIIYEIPWLFCIIYSFNQPIFNKLMVVAIVVMFISIIRSIWLAIKLIDVYDNEEIHTIRPTIVNNEKINQKDKKHSNLASCCGCLFALFIIIAVIIIL